ncbi:MAG: PQQ-binding-like beta-propeller repeat protein [Alphaproteobacteria bacterium]
MRLISLRLLIVLLASGLAACAAPGADIGTTVKGERIAVVPSAKTIESDPELKGQHFEISEPVTNKNWLQSGYDTTHVLPNAALAARPTEIWRADVGSGSDSDYKILARPIVGDGRVFTMDAQGTVRSFDVNSGDRIWEFDTTPEDRDTNAIGGGVALDGDTLYATTGFGEVLALGAAEGSVKWRKLLLNPLRAAPTIANNRVYVVSIDNKLQALDARTGEALWHHNGISESATLMGASNPAVSGDSLIVTYSSGEIYNLRAENGRASWSYGLTMPTQVGSLPAIADIRGLPVIDRGLVFAISHSGRMAAIDQRTGDRAWEADVGGINTPLVAGDIVYVLTNDGQLVALARTSGRFVWIQELQHLADPEDHDSDPVVWAGPTLAGNKLWLTNSMGQLVSFSPGNGSQEDVIDFGDATYIPPAVAGETLYVVTDNGYLVALR